MTIIESGAVGKPCCNVMLNTTSLFHSGSLQKLNIRSVAILFNPFYAIGLSIPLVSEVFRCCQGS